MNINIHSETTTEPTTLMSHPNITDIFDDMIHLAVNPTSCASQRRFSDDDKEQKIIQSSPKSPSNATTMSKGTPKKPRRRRVSMDCEPIFSSPMSNESSGRSSGGGLWKERIDEILNRNSTLLASPIDAPAAADDEHDVSPNNKSMASSSSSSEKSKGSKLVNKNSYKPRRRHSIEVADCCPFKALQSQKQADVEQSKAHASSDPNFAISPRTRTLPKFIVPRIAPSSSYSTSSSTIMSTLSSSSRTGGRGSSSCKVGEEGEMSPISGASSITRKEKEYKAWKKSRRHSMSDVPPPSIESLRELCGLPKMPFHTNGTDSNGNCVGGNGVASSRKNVEDALRKELGTTTQPTASRRKSSHNVRPKFVAPKGSSSQNCHDAQHYHHVPSSTNSVSSKQSSSSNTSRSSQKSSSSSRRNSVNRAAPPPPPATRTRNNQKNDPHGNMPQWKERRRHSMSDCAPPNFTTSCPQLPIDASDEDSSAKEVEASVNNNRTSVPPRKQTYGRRNSDFGPRYVSPIRSPFVERKSYFVNENGSPIVHGTVSQFAEKKSTLPASVASANNKKSNSSSSSGVENVDYSKWGAAMKRYQHEQKERMSDQGLKQKSDTTIPKPIRAATRRKSSTSVGEDGSISGVSISMSSHASTVSAMSNTDSVMRQYKRRELKARLGDSETVLMEEEGERSTEFPPSFCSNRPGRSSDNYEGNKEGQSKTTKKLNLPGYFRKRSNNTPVTLSCSSSDRSASMSTNHNKSSTSLRNVSNVDQLNEDIYIQVRSRNASLDDSLSSLEVSMRSSHLEYSPRKEMSGHIDGINERNAIRSSQRRASFSGIQVPWLPDESAEEECAAPTSSDGRGFDQDLVAERKFYGRVKSVGEALKVSQIKVGEGKKNKEPVAADYFCKGRRRLSDCGSTHGRPDMSMFTTDAANSWRQSLNNGVRDNHRTSSESLLTEDQEQGYSDTLRQMMQDHQDFLSNIGGRYNNGEARVSTGPTSREPVTASSDPKAEGVTSKGFSQGNGVDSDDYAGMLKKIWYQPNRKKWHRRGQQ